MINYNLKHFILFFALILFQVFIIDNIDLFSFSPPMIYISFIIIFKFDQNQPLFILLCFMLGLSIDFLSQSPGANTISSLTLGFIRPLIINYSFKINADLPNAAINDPNIKHRIIYTSSIIFIHHLLYFSIVYFNFNSFYLILKYTALSFVFSFILIWTLISFFKSDK
jgi:hypothetical protein